MVKKYCALSILVLIAALMVAVIPAYATGEPSDNALTRGNRFTVNITGLPGTLLYLADQDIFHDRKARRPASGYRSLPKRYPAGPHQTVPSLLDPI